MVEGHSHHLVPSPALTRADLQRRHRDVMGEVTTGTSREGHQQLGEGRFEKENLAHQVGASKK